MHTAQDSNKLARIASFLKLDPERLTREFFDHLPLVQRIAKTHPVDNLGAWRMLLAKMAHDPRRAHAHPMLALVPALVRYAAYGFTTAGIEQGFSRLQALVNTCDTHNPGTLNDLSVLISDPDPKVNDDTVRQAQVEWAEVYNNTRKSIQERIDNGLKRPQLQGSEKRWVHERRKSVQKALKDPKGKKKNTHINRKASRMAPRFWSQSHSKEMEFQREKRATNFIAGVASGNVLDAEVSQTMAHACVEIAQREVAKRRAYVTQKNNKRKATALSTSQHIKSKILYLVDAAMGMSVEKFYAMMKNNGLRKSTNPLAADIFVANNLNRVPTLVSWIAVLAGGRICHMDFVVSGGKSGASVAFRPALRTRRTVWCSPRFREQHMALFDALRELLRKPYNSWTYMADKTDFLAVAAKKIRAKKPTEVMALVTEWEQANDQETPTLTDARCVARARNTHEAAHTYRHAHTHTHTHARTRACVRACVRAHAHVQIRTSVRRRTHACTRLQPHVCKLVRAHTHTKHPHTKHTETHTRTHAHTVHACTHECTDARVLVHPTRARTRKKARA